MRILKIGLGREWCRTVNMRWEQTPLATSSSVAASNTSAADESPLKQMNGG
jgi:hypothetical protein